MDYFTPKLIVPLVITILIAFVFIEFYSTKMEKNDYISPKNVPFLTANPIEFRIKRMFELLPHDVIKSGFNRTLLIITYNHPHYESVALLKSVYQPIFQNVLTCGNPTKDATKPDIEIEIDRGYFDYKCTSHIMQKFQDYQGYMVVSDDMVLNWWQFHNFPKNKIWIDHSKYIQKVFKPMSKGWHWWRYDIGLSACKRFYEKLKPSNISKDSFKDTLFKNYMSSCDGEACCGNGRSDVYYIPKRFSKAFILLSNMAAKEKLFLEIAVPTILAACDLATNHEMLNGYYITVNEGGLSKADLYFWKMYDTKYHYVHSMKFSKDKLHGGKNYGLFQRYYVKYSNAIVGNNQVTSHK